MSSPHLIQKTESEVLEAAKAWARSVGPDRALTPQEQRLKMAVFMLLKASSLSGEHRLDLDRLKGL